MHFLFDTKWLLSTISKRKFYENKFQMATNGMKKKKKNKTINNIQDLKRTHFFGHHL